MTIDFNCLISVTEYCKYKGIRTVNLFRALEKHRVTSLLIDGVRLLYLDDKTRFEVFKNDKRTRQPRDIPFVTEYMLDVNKLMSPSNFCELKNISLPGYYNWVRNNRITIISPALSPKVKFVLLDNKAVNVNKQERKVRRFANLNGYKRRKKPGRKKKK